MSRRYAEGTTVAAEKSRAEIEQTLARYGADAFMYGVDGDRATIGFRLRERFVRFDVPLPALEDMRYRTVRGHKTRQPDAQAETARAQEVRRRWRALALAIKAKLEVVESEIATFEEEFLAHIVLPSGMTFGKWAAPELARAYTSGEMPAALPLLALPPAPPDTVT